MPETFSDKPDDVQKAIAEGDKERLSAMGRKGAKVAADNKAYRKAAKEAWVKDVVEGDLRGHVHDAGEHIVDDEGNVVSPADVSDAELERYIIERAHAVSNLEAKPKKR